MANQVQLTLVFVVTLFANSNAAPLLNLENINVLKEVHIARLDHVFDELLPRIRDFILQSGLDPMELPDKSESLLPDAPGMLKGKIDLKHGWLQEFSTIKRSRHVTATYYEKTLTLEMELGFDVLDFNYEYDLTYLLFSRKGDLNGRMFQLETKAVLTIDLVKLHFELESIKFTEVKDFDIKFEGNILDFLVNIASKAVTSIFRNSVLSFIENRTFEIFDEKFQDLNKRISRRERAMMIGKWLNKPLLDLRLD